MSYQGSANMGGSSHSGSHDKSTMVDTVDTAPEEAVLVDQDGRTAWLAGKLFPLP